MSIILNEDEKKQNDIYYKDYILAFSRTEDCFGNATAFCKLKNKNLNDWLTSDITKGMIDILISEYDEEAIKIENYEYWVHPNLFINLVLWAVPTINIFYSNKINQLFD